MNQNILFIGPNQDLNVAAITSVSDVHPYSDDLTQAGMGVSTGVLNLSGGEKISLRALSEQQQLSAWVDQSVLGTVLLLDQSNLGSGRFEATVDKFDALMAPDSLVVAVHDTSVENNPALNELHIFFKDMDWVVPVFQVDSENTRDMVTVLKTLLYRLDPGIDD